MHLPDLLLEWIEYIGLFIDLLGALVIAVGIVWGLAGWVLDRAKRADSCQIYQNCRQRIGRAIVLGLEILVASDIIHTVAIEPTFINAGVLALLIVVRTFISWSLILDLEARWPWQPSDTPPTPPAR